VSAAAHGAVRTHPQARALVVLSDTHLGARRHGPLPAPLLAACAHADLVLHAGDVTDPALLDELAAYAPLEAVLGNVDGFDLAARLPQSLVVDLGVARVGMLHDAGPERGRAERLVARFPSCGAVVFGHTHLPLCERQRGLLLLNPGSPTERRRAPHHAFALLDVGDDGSLDARIVAL
jgi:putative phosphoesterase